MAKRVPNKLQMPSTDDYRIASACHEFGHTIALHSFGQQVADFCLLQVERSENWRGQVALRNAHDIEPRTAISIWFAGPLAECLYWAAYDESQRRGISVVDALGATCFDETDQLTSFIEDVVRERKNGDIPKTCVRFLIAGKSVSCPQRTSAFEGDVRRAVAFAASTKLDPQQGIQVARRVLNAPACRQALAQFASYIAALSTKTVTVRQLLLNPHRASLVEHLRGQPDIELPHVEISLDALNSFLPPLGLDDVADRKGSSYNLVAGEPATRPCWGEDRKRGHAPVRLNCCSTTRTKAITH